MFSGLIDFNNASCAILSQRRRKIFQAGVLRWKANSLAGGLGGTAQADDTFRIARLRKLHICNDENNGDLVHT